jgi:hypothetical protein
LATNSSIFACQRKRGGYFPTKTISEYAPRCGTLYFLKPVDSIGKNLYLKGGRVVRIVFPFEKRFAIMAPTEWRRESNTLTCSELLPDFSIKVADILSSPALKLAQHATPVPNE